MEDPELAANRFDDPDPVPTLTLFGITAGLVLLVGRILVLTGRQRRKLMTAGSPITVEALEVVDTAGSAAGDAEDPGATDAATT